VAWVRWIGLGRIVAAAISVIVVIAGAVWLLRAPPPATEATLPITSGSVPAATLTPPSPPPSPPTATSVPAASLQVVVHVAGAVTAPGVYPLPQTARVADAVAAAGGPSPDGDLDALNLAAFLADGQRVYVPRSGEVDPASVPSGAAVSASADSPGGTRPPTGPIDLNTATAAELESLPGVGPATAAAIVDDRTRNGPFATVDDLDRVPGIGPAKLAALREHLTV
jgi:competence protein ComEA